VIRGTVALALRLRQKPGDKDRRGGYCGIGGGQGIGVMFRVLVLVLVFSS